MIATAVLVGAAVWVWWAATGPHSDRPTRLSPRSISHSHWECRCGRLETTPTPASDYARHVRLAHTKAPSGAGEDIA